jgi:tetratricopeptide (TPR) repeat protein
MEKHLRSVVLTLAVAGATLLTPLAVHAQPPAAGAPAAGAPSAGAPASAEDVEKKIAEAKSRYKSGLALYDDGAFEAARVQFERAYQLAPSYKILYNVGLVYKQLNEFVAALKSFQQYLAEGGNEVPADRREEVTKTINSLLLIVASATVTTNFPDAEIAVDDAVVG